MLTKFTWAVEIQLAWYLNAVGKMFQLDGFFPIRSFHVDCEEWYFLEAVKLWWVSTISPLKLVISQLEPQRLRCRTSGFLLPSSTWVLYIGEWAAHHPNQISVIQATGVPSFSLAGYPVVECVQDSSWKVINWILFSHRNRDIIWNFMFYQPDSKWSTDRANYTS